VGVHMSDGGNLVVRPLVTEPGVGDQSLATAGVPTAPVSTRGRFLCGASVPRPGAAESEPPEVALGFEPKSARYDLSFLIWLAYLQEAS
jgi:hypothetical protein